MPLPFIGNSSWKDSSKLTWKRASVNVGVTPTMMKLESFRSDATKPSDYIPCRNKSKSGATFVVCI